MAVLTNDELVQAVREWCVRRGLPFTEHIEIHGRHVKGAPSVVSSPNYAFSVEIRGIELPEKEGPYR